MGSVVEKDTLPPPGAWDSHVHVIDEDRFPLHPVYPYHPGRATVEDLDRFHRDHGISHACLVAFSVYHTDNRSIIDALHYFGGKARAVACIDPETVTDFQLNLLHAAGVRGIRLNLRTRGDSLDLDALKKSAARVRPLGWALQMYVSLSQVADLAPEVAGLGVPIVIDHIGHPDPTRGPGRSQRGYRELLELLRTGQVWTKLSGTYRFPGLSDLDEYAMDILKTAPDRVVWASDWPHSGGVEANPGGDRTKLQPYRKIDNKAWIAQCRAWCKRVEGGTGEGLARKIWVENPRALWQYDDVRAGGKDTDKRRSHL